MTMTPASLDPESCYRAVKSRDRRFDGVFYTAVRTTGIYCRPSCPARTPASHNVTFHPSAAVGPGRRLPRLQALPARRHPGQPRLGRRRHRGRPGDAADRRRRRRPRGRRRAGPPGRLHATTPHPAAHRRSSAPGRWRWPGPAAPRPRGCSSRPPSSASRTSRSRPASPASASSTTPSARSTPPTPTELRGRRRGTPAHGTVTMRLAVRTPFAGRALLDFLAYHVVPGVEAPVSQRAGAGTPAPSTSRTAPGTVRLELDDAPTSGPDRLRVRRVPAARPARHHCRRRAGAPAGRRRLRPDRRRRPVPGDAVIGPLVRGTRGLRVPGQVDGDETRGPHGGRPAGQRHRRPHRHRPARRGVRHSASTPRSQG